MVRFVFQLSRDRSSARKQLAPQLTVNRLRASLPNQIQGFQPPLLRR